MGTTRAFLGGEGERLAADHLSSLGYEIVERNYRCNYGEIDIVARHDGDLVFVEVKTRRSNAFGFPSESVDTRKQGKLIRAAQNYLSERDLGEVDSRFDVVEVYMTKGTSARIEILRGAFSSGY